jgi:hypothetical protein
MYELLNNSNLSWECAKCGMPNFSTTFFNSTIETSNSFLALDDEEGIQDSICKPSHHCSPIHRQTFKSKSSKIDSPSPLRVLTINFQSIKSKKPELDQITESCKPTIIFDSETWLSDNISPYEYFVPTKYTLYSKNRKDGYGGVLIAISNEYITSQATELDTNCEIVWATIKSTGNKTLYLGTYCIPPSDKGESLEQLNESINRVCNKTNVNILLR